jgi:hypothetical protein
VPLLTELQRKHSAGAHEVFFMAYLSHELGLLLSTFQQLLTLWGWTDWYDLQHDRFEVLHPEQFKARLVEFGVPDLPKPAPTKRVKTAMRALWNPAQKNGKGYRVVGRVLARRVSPLEQRPSRPEHWEYLVQWKTRSYPSRWVGWDQMEQPLRLHITATREEDGEPELVWSADNKVIGGRRKRKTGDRKQREEERRRNQEKRRAAKLPALKLPRSLSLATPLLARQVFHSLYADITARDAKAAGNEATFAVLPDQTQLHASITRFRELTECVDHRAVCAVCGAFHDRSSSRVFYLNPDRPSISMEPLSARVRKNMQKVCTRREVQHGVPWQLPTKPASTHPGLHRLDGMLLQWRYYSDDYQHLRTGGIDEDAETITFCGRCFHHLSEKNCVNPPKFGLSNGFLFGMVPYVLLGLTLAERIAVMPFRIHSCIMELHVEDPAMLRTRATQLKLKGNVVVFPQNNLSLTAASWPARPADLADTMHIVVLNPYECVPDDVELTKLLGCNRVRIRKALEYFRTNETFREVCVLFVFCFDHCLRMVVQIWRSMTGQDLAEVPFDEKALAEYPESDVIPEVVRKAMTVSTDAKSSKKARGTSSTYTPYGPEADPVVQDYTPDPDAEDASLTVGAGGMSDAAGAEMKRDASLVTSSAMLDAEASGVAAEVLADILTAKLGKGPVRTVEAFAFQRGAKPVNEYRRFFWLGAFPELFPLGLGVPNDYRDTYVSPSEYFQHLFLLADPRFRLHPLFAPVAWNVTQRHRLRHSTQMSAAHGQLDDFADVFKHLTAERIEQALADLRAVELQKGWVETKHIKDDGVRMVVMRLMKELKTVNQRLPLTRSSKLRSKDEMYSLMLANGAPDFFITLNPCDLHSPLLCTMAGVKLKLFEDAGLYGHLPDAAQRALLVARHPYEAARFAYAVLDAFCKALLGFGSSDGAPLGIFGKVRAYYLVPEEQLRGSLHFHGVFWLENKPSPAVFEQRLKNDAEFQKRLLRYLESVIENEDPLLRQGECPVSRPVAVLSLIRVFADLLLQPTGMNMFESVERFPLHHLLLLQWRLKFHRLVCPF